MDEQFVAAFPGLFLNSLDSAESVKKFADSNRDKYDIELNGNGSWKRQAFLFGFTGEYVTKAYEGFKEKGEDALKKAEQLRPFFKRKFEAELCHLGILVIKVTDIEKMADVPADFSRTEIGFQLYHVAKTLFSTIQEEENPDDVSFTKSFTSLGQTGLESLALRFAEDTRLSLVDQLRDTQRLVKDFRSDLQNSLIRMPLGILLLRKGYREFTRLCIQRLDTFQNSFERNFIFLFRRMAKEEKSTEVVIADSEEGLALLRNIHRRFDRIHDFYSFQVGICAAFLGIIGTTIAVASLVLALRPLPIASVLTLALSFALLTVFEIILLEDFSAEKSIEAEFNAIISEAEV